MEKKAADDLGRTLDVLEAVWNGGTMGDAALPAGSRKRPGSSGF